MTGARARSPDAKRARRQSILTTAEQILRSGGFDAFTMNSLATTTGLAKGTLYLYFSSREELVLALYIHLNDDWVDRFLLACKINIPGMQPCLKSSLQGWPFSINCRKPYGISVTPL